MTSIEDHSNLNAVVGNVLLRYCLWSSSRQLGCCSWFYCSGKSRYLDSTNFSNWLVLFPLHRLVLAEECTVGDIGVSPASGSFLTGFGLTRSARGTFSTSPQVVGRLLAADYSNPTPSQLTSAVSDMQTAFTDAAGRVDPDEFNLGSGMYFETLCTHIYTNPGHT